MAEEDRQLEFKKRARRRLVGAVALALTGAVVLPLVMEGEPRQSNHSIQMRIPGQDAPPPMEGGDNKPMSEPDSGSVKPAEEPGKSVAKAQPPAAAAAAQTKASPSGAPLAPAIAPPPEKKPPAKADNKPAKADAAKAQEAADKERKAAEMAAREKREAESRVKREREAEAEAAKAKQRQEREQAELKARREAEQEAKAKAKREAELEAKIRGEKEAAAKAKADAAGAAGDGQRFVVQLGTFSDPANARQLQEKLKAQGFTVTVETIGSGADAKTRVRHGPFDSRAAAEKAREQIKRAGVAGVIATR